MISLLTIRSRVQAQWRALIGMGAIAAACALAEPLRAAEDLEIPPEAFEQFEGDRPENIIPGLRGEPPDEERAGEPPASTPSKRDREDLIGREELDHPALRAEMLKQLYAELRRAKDASSAGAVEAAIEEVWRRSGSDTVDLLMQRVDQFVLENDLELAQNVLDAVVEIAPQEAEVWYQRGIVNMMRQDFRRALTDFKRSLGIDPKHYKANRELGALLVQIGDKKGALKAYRAALEVNPFLEQAREAEKRLSFEVEGQDI